MKNVFLSAAAIAVCISSVLATYAFLYTGGPGFFSPTGSQGGYPLGHALLAIGALLSGIVFGGMHKRLRDMGDEPVDAVSEFRALLRSGEFASSVLVAPIVFCGVYIAIKQQPDRVIAFLFAFQNGFFWDQIFARTKAALPATLKTVEPHSVDDRASDSDTPGRAFLEDRRTPR